MGMMDNMSQDQIKSRIEELSNMDKAGELNDAGREELAQLRSRM